MYCLYDDCPTDPGSGPGLCEGVDTSTEVRGCVRPDSILRDEVINVTDFTGASVGDCTRRCRELEGEGFGLTRSGQNVECIHLLFPFVIQYSQESWCPM